MSKQKSYLEQRRELKLSGPKPKSVERKEKSELAEFFRASIKKAPDRCEECKKPLAGTKAINQAAVVAHILPKSKKQGVPSMAKHPLNVVFLCGDCHTNFDNQGEDFLKEMKILPRMKVNVAVMWPDIPESERRRVPELLKP